MSGDRDPPFFADRRALRLNFEKAATTFTSADALHREIGSRMAERLELVKLEPAWIVDLGCGIGADFPALARRFPRASIMGVDFAVAMARRAAPALPAWQRWLTRNRPKAVCADMAALPLATNGFELAWSNLALHWLDDPEPAVREAQRILCPGGLFMFSSLGPDTLGELRDVCREALGSGVHVRSFIDLHDLGDLLGRAGFAAPVMDMERITLTYPDAAGLVADLRKSGSGNAMRGRSRGLLSRAAGQRFAGAAQRAMRDGRLAVTFEVIYGHAWKGAPRRTASGDAIVNFIPRRK
ncbi:MAG: methyltransferase domain-containing protein [Burkholderiales bacterium]|nr:methyltransferase domain-containing protein [Burkholderiales bacterium]